MPAMSMANAIVRLEAWKKSSPASRTFGCRRPRKLLQKKGIKQALSIALVRKHYLSAQE